MTELAEAPAAVDEVGDELALARSWTPHTSEDAAPTETAAETAPEPTATETYWEDSGFWGEVQQRAAELGYELTPFEAQGEQPTPTSQQFTPSELASEIHSLASQGYSAQDLFAMGLDMSDPEHVEAAREAYQIEAYRMAQEQAQPQPSIADQVAYAQYAEAQQQAADAAGEEAASNAVSIVLDEVEKRFGFTADAEQVRRLVDERAAEIQQRFGSVEELGRAWNDGRLALAIREAIFEAAHEASPAGDELEHARRRVAMAQMTGGVGPARDARGRFTARR